MYIYIYICIWLVVASGRTRRLVISCVFYVKWVRWGVGGWGVGGWVRGDVNVHWTCALAWCYATARSLQFTQLRDATLLHVLFSLHNYVMLRWLGWVGGWLGMLTFIGLAHLRDATLLHVLFNLHRKVKTLVGSEVNPSLRRRCFQYVWRCNLQTCTPLVMLKELAKLVKNNDGDNC